MVEPLSRSVVKLVEYGYRNELFVFKDLDQYHRHEGAGIKRMFCVNFCRLQIIIGLLRFSLLSYFKNQMMREIMVDAIYNYPNRTVLYLILSAGHVFTLSIFVFMEYLEANFKSPIMDLFHSISKGSLPFILSPSDEKRLTLILHLLTKYVVRQTYCLLMAISSAFYLYQLINAYYELDSGLTLFWIFVWFCPTYLALSQTFGNNFKLV